MKLRPFELALVVIFAGLLIGALVLLKFYQPAPDDEIEIPVGAVSIWGVLPTNVINDLIAELAIDSNSYNEVTYRYISPDVFDSTLTTALADDVGPDIVLISHEDLVEMRKRIQPVSYEFFPLRDFRNSYIDGAEIFALADGVYSYPLVVDPLMVYWNRDMLTTEGYFTAPKTWEELVNDVFPVIIKRDFDRTISRSVVAMGEYGNVRNAFGTLSALLIQQGTLGVTEQSGSQYLVQLDQSSVVGNTPLTKTADFYTRFSRPSNALYSWNRSLPEDRQQFIGENLAFYFGFGSEAMEIERLNPNLNFDIAEIPQGEAATVRRTYGKFYGLSLLKSSDNQAGAGAVMLQLGNAVNVEKIAQSSGMVPAFRNLIAQGSNGKYSRTTYQSAGIARGWLNPDLQKTSEHFDTMMRDINENRNDTNGATDDLEARLRGEY
jgi:ABC-type glycerol-3-phosphate transport system substrate-binding protein